MRTILIEGVDDADDAERRGMKDADGAGGVDDVGVLRVLMMSEGMPDEMIRS